MNSSLRRGSLNTSMTSLRSQPAIPPKPTGITVKKNSAPGSYKASSGGHGKSNAGGKMVSKQSSSKVISD